MSLKALLTPKFRFYLLMSSALQTINLPTAALFTFN